MLRISNDTQIVTLDDNDDVERETLINQNTFGNMTRNNDSSLNVTNIFCGGGVLWGMAKSYELYTRVMLPAKCQKTFSPIFAYLCDG